MLLHRSPNQEAVYDETGRLIGYVEYHEGDGRRVALDPNFSFLTETRSKRAAEKRLMQRAKR